MNKKLPASVIIVIGVGLWLVGGQIEGFVGGVLLIAGLGFAIAGVLDVVIRAIRKPKVKKVEEN